MELKEIVVKSLWVICLCLYFYVLLDKRKIRKLLSNNVENNNVTSKPIEKVIKRHNILMVITVVMSVVLLIIK